MTKRLGAVGILGATIWMAAWLLTEGRAQTPSSERPIPILVELFTSEGCSSCPPADALLEKLDRSQPVPGAELIVLSEHVDYWNYIGWKDPYSSHSYSERQSSYAQRFGRDTVYTPEMVIDGSHECLGSDARSADLAIVQALRTPKIGIRLSGIAIEGERDLKAHLETDILPMSLGQGESDIYVAVVFTHAESNVSAGENSGRTLTHTGVVKRLVKLGAVRSGQSFAKDLQMKLEAGTNRQNLRLVAFIQEPGAGRVMGATMQSAGK
jgi:hypothetical protein